MQPESQYHLVAILGPQSSGKSTLLNRLFGTDFNVMDEKFRSQTTHGVWISKSKYNEVLVLDVEGTDGRERAEDHDFERKSALFSLAVAEILIVNIWEHAIGLYQSANLSLLKTVMEVHLQLFHNQKSAAKTMIMFVVRDFIGKTPAENLKATILEDLEKIWSNLSKPDDFSDTPFSDIFLTDFSFLPHKVLQEEEFDKECSKLSKRFSDDSTENYAFNNFCSEKIVPLDGLPLYLESIWNRIITNKDIDLPDQQQLLAQYRCDELFQDAFQEFTEKISSESLQSTLIDKCDSYSKCKNLALDMFSNTASRYNRLIFEKKLMELSERIDNHLYPLVLGILQDYRVDLVKKLYLKFEDKLKGKNRIEFIDQLKSTTSESLCSLQSAVEQFKRHLNESWNFSSIVAELKAEMEELQLRRINERFENDLNQSRKLITADFQEQLSLDKLAELKDVFGEIENQVQVSWSEFSSKCSLIAEELSKTCDLETIRKSYCELLEQILKKNFTGSHIRKVAMEKFERVFRYDDQGRRKIWLSCEEIDRDYDDAKSDAVNFFENISHESIPFLNDHIEFIAKSQILDAKSIFLKEIDQIYFESKRGIISQTTKIPPWIYLLMIVLGWNEFISIISSPLYLTISILLIFSYITVRILGLESMVLQALNAKMSEAQSFMNQLKQPEVSNNIKDE